MTVRSFLGSTAGLVATLIFAGIGGWLLWSHTGHVLLAVPYLFLLACPLMHLFHKGHGHHSGSEKAGKKSDHHAELR